MSNVFDETRAAVANARQQLHAVDKVAYDLADLLAGRLRKVDSPSLLAKLKRELNGFNAKTGRWVTR